MSGHIEWNNKFDTEKLTKTTLKWLKLLDYSGKKPIYNFITFIIICIGIFNKHGPEHTF